jgi:murein DD-endopeptidase MepM/ murein hydrolase activator NlpD
VNGPVTSGYGWREHPVLGGRRFHTGIDIGASTGTLIAAAGDGTVVYAGMKAGYGNTVIIDHGGGIATLYAHQSKIAVDSGVPVTRGQRVGAVGCTGYCTGPHLHFEVRVNGDPVDPMGWLP